LGWGMVSLPPRQNKEVFPLEASPFSAPRCGFSIAFLPNPLFSTPEHTPFSLPPCSVPPLRIASSRFFIRASSLESVPSVTAGASFQRPPLSATYLSIVPFPPIRNAIFGLSPCWLRSPQIFHSWSDVVNFSRPTPEFLPEPS